MNDKEKQKKRTKLVMRKPGESLRPVGVSCSEVVKRRAINSKTWDLGKGKHKLIVAKSPVHYQAENGRLCDIDLTVTDLGGGAVGVREAPYLLTLHTDRVGYSYTSRRGGQIDIELIEVGDELVNYDSLTTSQDGNQFFWDGIAPGLRFKAQLKPNGVEIFKELADENAPRRFVWRVRQDVGAACSFQAKSGGYDSAPRKERAMGRLRRLEMINESQPVENISGGQREQFTYEERWTGRVSTVKNPKTRQKTWTDKAIYPIIIDVAVVEHIAATLDDGFQIWTTTPVLPAWYTSSTTIRVGRLTTTGPFNFDAGFRFTTIPVPQGAAINSAVIKFFAFEGANNPGGCPTLIQADDVDDAPAFSAGDLPRGITPTAASTAFTIPYGTTFGWTTANVTAVVQEVISRGGWNSNNDMRFGVWRQLTATQNQGYIIDYTYNPALAAILEIDYTAPIIVPTFEGISRATHHQSLGLSVLAFKPTIGSYTVRGTLFDGDIASKMDSLSIEKHADGGWWAASITLNARLTDAELWFSEGLNLNIEIYNPGLVRIFRGFVNVVELSAGALSAQRGPVLDVVNRLSMTYAPILDATANPPIYGIETTTVIAEDADSQAKYGIIEKVFAAEPGRCLQTQAEQQRDTFLNELKEAQTSEDAGFSAQNVTQVVLRVLGYRHRLNTYIHQNTTAATVQIDTKIEQALASDPNALFSTDYTDIGANAFLVNQFEDDNRTAEDVIQNCVEIGGATSDNRYLFGIYDYEKARYNAIPTTAMYQHRILDKFRRIEIFGTGELVRPWDVRPGQFLFFPDFLIGRTQPTELRNDPRYLFIESVTFSTPYDIQINGARLSTIPQLLAKARTLE